jgi:hypothetical protein
VDRQRAAEDEASGVRPPGRHQGIEHGIGLVERDDQEAVRRQMADDESKQDETACETQIAPRHPQACRPP